MINGSGSWWDNSVTMRSFSSLQTWGPPRRKWRDAFSFGLGWTDITFPICSTYIYLKCTISLKSIVLIFKFSHDHWSTAPFFNLRCRSTINDLKRLGIARSNAMNRLVVSDHNHLPCNIFKSIVIEIIRITHFDLWPLYIFRIKINSLAKTEHVLGTRPSKSPAYRDLKCLTWR